jgi:hypothetical protein
MVNDRKCRIRTSNEYCHVHKSDGKLLNKVKSQKEELTILNRKLADACRKLHVIDEIDRIKSELRPVSQHCSFRYAIGNSNNRELVEKIFDAPFEECKGIYDKLLEERNNITHRYSKKDWDTGEYIPTLKKRTYYRSVRVLASRLG